MIKNEEELLKYIIDSSMKKMQLQPDGNLYIQMEDLNQILKEYASE